MDIRRHESVDALDPEAWAALDPAPRMTPAWFATSEAYFQDTNHVYFTAWDGGELKAILPLYDHFDPAYFNAPKRFGPMTRLALGRRFWSVGSRLGFECHAIGDPAFEEALLAEAADWARAEGAGFIAVNFRASPLPGWEEHALGFIFNKYVMEFKQETYEAYLKGLKSSGRKLVKQDARGGSWPIVQTPLLGNEKRLNALRTISCGRQGAKNHLSDSFFTELARAFGDDAILLASGPEDDWTGACLMISTKTRLCGIGIGARDRDRTYFNLLVHEPVKLAFSTGRRELDLGAACDKGKRSRGGAPVPLHAYLKPLAPRCAVAVQRVAPVDRFGKRVQGKLRRLAGMNKPS